jgi:ketosteroid isomerase-like protein
MFFLQSCELKVRKGETIVSENYKEIVKKVDASFAENRTEDFLSLCAENIVWKMVGDVTKTGKDSIRKWMSSMGEEMEPPKISQRNIIAEGETVAAYGEMTMKNEKGEDAAYEYCDIYRFENDKIAELTSYVVKTDK